MELSEQELSHLEQLSRLRTPEAERPAMRQSIAAILDYLSSLQKIGTDGVDPTFRGAPVDPVLRPDTIDASDEETVQALQQAVPDFRDGHVRVQAALAHKSRIANRE